jgi:hypothetical protein
MLQTSLTYCDLLSWRRIKKDFLHHFPMPRIDLLVWILVTKLAPHYCRKLDHALNNHGRYRELPSWRKEFKRDWKKAARTPASELVDVKYKPDPWRWVCTCPHFVKSRFLICKHLVQLVQPVPAHFFLQVRRNGTTPFWSHENLIPIIPNPRPPIEGHQPVAQPEPLASESQQNEDEEQSGSEDEDGLIDTGARGTFRERMDEHQQTLREFCDILEYQTQFNDHRMLATLERDGAGLLRLARNCIMLEKRANSSRSSTPTTFERSTHNATFFRIRPWPSERDT